MKQHTFWCLIGLGLVSQSFALPFSVVADSPLPLRYPAVASYTITRNTPIAPTGNIVKWLPPNTDILALGTTCATNQNEPFTLNYGQSCHLNLYVYGVIDRNDSNPDHHLMVCMSDRASCAGPDPENSLNVSGERSTRSNFSAVGSYMPSPLNSKPLSYYTTNAGATWAVSTVLPLSPADPSYLTSSACGVEGQFCTAVGYSGTLTTATPISFKTQDAGVTWQRSTTMPTQYFGSPVVLNSVACGVAGQQCTAVGYYLQAGQTIPVSFFTTDGGDVWTPSATQPPALNANDHVLHGVACGSDGLSCTAVGNYNNGIRFIPLSYVTTNGGNTWTASTTQPAAQGISENTLQSVACDTTGQVCTTVGDYFNVSRSVPLSYVSLDGGSNWTVSALPSAQGTGNNALYGVTCDLATGKNCTTVGSYILLGFQLPLSYYSMDGGASWMTSLQQPPASGTDNSLYSVHCDIWGVTCTAVGQHTVTGQVIPLSHTSNDGGRRWNLSSGQPAPQSNFENTLQSVG